MASIVYPEEKIARKILSKHSLEIPFDLDKLVRNYANLIYKSIPISGVDGLSLNIKVVGKIPTVIINQNAPRTRQLFTLAHELGHLIIPWHCGIDIEDIDTVHSEWIMDLKYREMEEEANRFAAEILMPQSCIEKLLLSDTTLASLHFQVCSLTGVSEQAAAIRLSQILPKNILYCAEADGIILYSGVSNSTMAKIPSKGTFKVKEMFPDADYSCNSVKGARIHWWRLDEKKVNSSENDTRTWREILDTMTSHFNEKDRHKIKASINAKIAYVNGEIKRKTEPDVDSLYTECYYRLLHDDKLLFLVSHPDFKIFLSKKAIQLNVG